MNLTVADVVRLLKTIADETRIRILGIVAEGPVTGKDLADRLDLTPATISHHVRKLVDAGVLIAHPDAQRVRYSLDTDLLLAARRVHVGNTPPLPTTVAGDSDADAAFREKVLRDFFVGERLKEIPAQRKRRVIVLQHIVRRFDPSRTYTEREINDLLRPAHEDVATLRRELVDYRFMTRASGIYCLARDGPTRSAQVAQEITGSETLWLQSILTGVIGSLTEASAPRRKEQAVGFASREAAMHWHHIELQVDRIVATSADQSVAVRNWRPAAPDTNSIHVLAVHTIANVRQAVIEALFNEPTGRDRDAEFVAVADETNNQADVWPRVKAELLPYVQRLNDGEMSELRLHPRRGEREVREILVMASTHAAEHAGHCELTRDLAIASGV